MNKKIAIVGGGLFGITSYIVLKREGYDCVLFEKNKDLLLGASTNNLNRVHFGYHYPRDDKTARQSLKGYESFRKVFSKSIISKFRNFYFIADKSKVNFDNYLKFCKRNRLKFKKVISRKFNFELNNIQGGIEVNEPIYDWEIIKQNTKSIIKKLKKNQIFINEKVIEIKKKNKYEIITNKKIYNFDIIIDASYENSNHLIRNFSKIKKKKYQLVVVFEFISRNFDKMGFALMDGDFFSFLPKGNKKKHLLYHVKHSIIKQKISNEFPLSWKKLKKFSFQIERSKKLILKDLKKYLPNLNINFTENKYINARVLPTNVEKTDRRISKVTEISKNYLQIFSAKVDHSVDIAYEILNRIKKV